MVSQTRKDDLAEIANLESFINKNVKEDKSEKELFSKEDIEVKTDLSEEEISIIARLKFLCDELDLDKFRKALTYFMELRVSKGRKSRKEFLDALGKSNNNNFGMQGQGNMGGFSNGRM